MSCFVGYNCCSILLLCTILDFEEQRRFVEAYLSSAGNHNARISRMLHGDAVLMWTILNLKRRSLAPHGYVVRILCFEEMYSIYVHQVKSQRMGKLKNC